MPGQSSRILSPDRGLHKMFFLPLTMPSPWMIWKPYSIIYLPWKTQNNIINIGGAINLQVVHVFTETPCIQIYIFCKICLSINEYLLFFMLLWQLYQSKSNFIFNMLVIFMNFFNMNKLKFVFFATLTG